MAALEFFGKTRLLLNELRYESISLKKKLVSFYETGQPKFLKKHKGDS
jgi:hypothetical protein